MRLKPRGKAAGRRLMNDRTDTSQPDKRAEALVAAYERAGYRRRARHPAAGRAVPRSVGRGHPQAHVSHHRSRRAANSACGRTSPSRCRATISPRRRPARRRASAISARCSATAATRPPEFLQAGIESFGRPDKAAADAEMLALGLEATAHYGVPAPTIRMGDVGLFAALIAALDLAPAWKRRLVKDFNRKTTLAHDLDVLSARPPRTRRRNIRACWRRSPAPIRRARTRWSPICCRSPASPRSAAARSARSPIASSNRRRSAPPTRCPARRAR